MALYAIGDLHLATVVDKPMDKFGEVWADHETKIFLLVGKKKLKIMIQY